MASIDERVVSIKFDNAQFENGIKQSSSSLKKFTSLTGLDGLKNGLSKLKGMFSGLDLSGVQNNIQTVGSKFGFLQTAASVAFGTIAAKAAMAGSQMVASFGMRPITDGFREYELKMGSIQTILANTQKYGTKLGDVTKSLNDLNEYSDKTIYNFGDMTRNIGLFTNAGLKLEESTSMIKGFSNAAAASGTTAQGAAGAAYQLSQALSAGTIRLIDWRSLTNVGMGNKNMQEGLIQIADAMGTLTESGISAADVQKDFNGSLEKGWLSADVMSNYLQIMAGDMDEAKMKSLGLTDAQIKNFEKQQKTAEDAATKVRTFTQLIGTIGEAIGSGWSQTFEILLGNFDEATALFTDINNVVSDLVGNASNARNNLLQGWKDLGGRTKIINALANAFNGVMSIVKVLGAAFKTVFPPMTAKALYDFSVKVENFSKKLILSTSTLNKLSKIFRAVFSVLKMGVDVVLAIAKSFGILTKGAGKAGSGILDFAVKIADWILKITSAAEKSKLFERVVTSIAKVIHSGLGAIGSFVSLIGKLASAIGGTIAKAVKFNSAFDLIAKAFEKLSSFGVHIFDGFSDFGDSLSKAGSAASSAGDKISSFIWKIADAIQSFKDSGGFGILFAGILTGSGFKALKSVTDVFKTVKEILSKKSIQEVQEAGKGFVATIKETFGGLTETLSTMQNTLKATTLIEIAAAIGIITASVVALSKIDAASLSKALFAIGTMMVELTTMMDISSKILGGNKIKGLVTTGIALIAFAGAVKVLASVVDDLGKLDIKTLAKGIVSVGILLTAVVASASILDKKSGSTIRAGIAMIAFAAAVKILATAVDDLGKLDMKTLAKGIGAVGFILAEIAGFTVLTSGSKGMISSGVGILIVSKALSSLTGVVRELGGMDIQTLGKGLGSMAIGLAAISGALMLVPPSSVLSAAAIFIVAQSLGAIADVVNEFGGMDILTLAKGLISLAVSLGIISGALYLMQGGLLGAAAMIVVAKAIDILVPSLQSLGDMSWGEIAKAMGALSGALVILAIGVAAMSSSLAGAAALAVVSASLMLLVPALQALGSMSWDEIGKGLLALAGALLIFAVGGILLTSALPGLLGFGAALLLIGAGIGIAGAGIGALAAGFAMLGNTVLLLGTNLASLVLAFASTIPELAKQVGLGIVAMLNVIAQNGASFVSAAVTIITSLLNAIIMTAPKFGQTILVLIMTMLNVINVAIPSIVRTGINLIMSFLNAISNNIGKIVGIVANLITNFLDALAKRIPSIVDAGINLIIQFMNGISNGISSHQGALNEAGSRLVRTLATAIAGAIGASVGGIASAAASIGSHIISGIKSGIDNGWSLVTGAISSLATSALDKAKSILGIHSPSRKFAEIGMYSVMGWSNGLKQHGSEVQTETANLAKKITEKFNDNIDFDYDGPGSIGGWSPTVKPVMDLSDIRRGAQEISDILGDPAIDASITGANAAQAVMATGSNVPSATATSVTPTTVNYNQYNNSPKALSASEIYRQTKNLISVSKNK